MTFPVWEYPHSSDEIAVIGGHVYNGAAIPDLVGKYVYGDLGGQIWSLDLSGPTPINEEIVSADVSELCSGVWCMTSFGQDAAGELYIASREGPVRKIAPVSDLQIACTPVDAQVDIPPDGGVFSYEIEIVNNGDSEATFDVWFGIEGPGVNRTRGPFGLTLGAGGSFMRTVNQSVPAGASAGAYTNSCSAGTFPVAETTSSFDWTKSASAYPNLAVRGAWSDDFEPVSEAMRTPGEPVPPSATLAAGYPNPFNPSTTIRFSLGEAGSVRLVVFDILGREIRTLVEGRLDAGNHQVVFDAEDLPGGTYLYRLETPRGSLVRSVMLIK